MQPKKFCKMHGLGNDFVLIDTLQQPFNWSRDEIMALADRHLGIGFDQLLLVERASVANCQFAYRIFNADGSEVEHCGNGARCFGKYVRDNNLHDFTKPIAVQIKKGIIEIAYAGNYQQQDYFSVVMGSANFGIDGKDYQQEIEFDNKKYKFTILSLGNPHAVTVVADLDNAPVRQLGAALQTHSLFAQQVNVGFMQIVDENNVRLRVYERGVGETLACGSGACAAVAAGRKLNLLAAEVWVQLLGGRLQINCTASTAPITMTGAAVHVYNGEII